MNSTVAEIEKLKQTKNSLVHLVIIIVEISA